MKLLAEKLYRMRKSARQTLQEVADGIGVSKTHIWELEQGRATNPSINLLSKLALHFRVSVVHLIDETETSKALDHQLYKMIENLSKRNKEIVYDLMKSMVERQYG